MSVHRMTYVSDAGDLTPWFEFHTDKNALKRVQVFCGKLCRMPKSGVIITDENDLPETAVDVLTSTRDLNN